MTAEIVKHDGEEITIQVKVKLTGSLFEAEQAILNACNEVETLATSQAIKQFDTDGSPIQVAGVKLTAKQAVAIVTKRLTARWKYRAMFIKPPKVARLTARWSKMPALFVVQCHATICTTTLAQVRQQECASGLRRFGR
jgi:hypothetical protein